MLNLFQDDDPKKDTIPSKPKKTLPSPVKNGKQAISQKVAGTKVLRGKTRGAASEDTQEIQAKLTAHQKILHQQRQQEGLARWAGEEGDLTNKEGKQWKKFQSYRGEAGLPEMDELKVMVIHTIVLS